jgi:hypothetical protein
VPLHVANPGLERDELSTIVLRILFEMVDKVPAEALPPLVTKRRIRSLARHIVENLTTEQLLDITTFADYQLGLMFEKVSGDWMKEKAGIIQRTAFPATRKAMARAGIGIVQ